MNNHPHPDDDRAERGQAGATPDGHDSFGGNPYASHIQRDPEPDLDASAPQLRAVELRRMNRRALLLLATVVLLLMVVAYWMFTSAGGRHAQPKPREEKVTIAEAPNTLRIPQLPPSPPTAAPQAAAPIPVLPDTPVPPIPTTTVQPPVARGPNLLQRRIAASAAEEQDPAAGNGQAVLSRANAKLPNGDEAGPASAQPLPHADTLMQRGTYIRCVLETRIVSDVPGFSTCLVTEAVYSFNGHTLLLPKGSKLLGAYNHKPTGNRMEVVWDRIITPTGIDVNMASPGMDNLGGAGLPGYYDAHWGQRVTSALLISLLSDAFKYEAAEHGPRNSTVGNGFVTQTPFESNTAQTVQQLADQAVREAANRRPTVTINQGTVIYVYVAKDVDFSGVVARF